jgi:hypothetical protein
MEVLRYFKLTGDEEKHEKEIQYYAANLNAWFTTKLEGTKSLILLSSAGIGLFITILTTIGVSSLFILICYILGILSFVICSISAIFIFDINGNHIKEVILKSDNKKTDICLKILDKTSYYSFAFGIVFAFIIGLSVGIENYKTPEKDMQMFNIKKEFIDKSFRGIRDLNPNKTQDHQNTINNQQNNSGNQGQSTDKNSKVENQK